MRDGGGAKQRFILLTTSHDFQFLHFIIRIHFILESMFSIIPLSIKMTSHVSIYRPLNLIWPHLKELEKKP